MQGKFGDGATISLPADLQGFNPAVPNLKIQQSLQPPNLGENTTMLYVINLHFSHLSPASKLES
jgi:hypothetical protein